jgi:hypothetical protein
MLRSHGEELLYTLRQLPEKTALTFTAQQSRVDALIRLIGLIILIFGLVLIYYTYANAGVSGIAPEIVTTNYALGILLSLVGLFATFAKFK